ncbi:MAG: chemotaxis protein CheB [Bacteroidota bacterium]
MRNSSINAKKDRIIVVGTSAGGMAALVQLVKQLPADFDIPLLVVQHISSDATGNALPRSNMGALRDNGYSGS